MNKYVSAQFDITSLDEESLEIAKKEARNLLDQIEARLKVAKAIRHRYSSCQKTPTVF